ncbi:MAG: hypothetical protein WC231_02120 [Dehalococcoidales bacterium]|jgi:uncharacterized lipoprotein NlpE involved in copper resistance|nr:hypothetical protein [Dehalococcoidales bacterium]MDD5604909.1 hypothetical protein [Dehalococcoidales bacterium]MDX9986945.1 hypothetical protein [Dehalococcoidales bacterium]
MGKNKIVSALAVAFLLTVFSLTGCNNPSEQTTTPPLTTEETDGVEVNFFYESDNCFCLNLAVEWVNTVMHEDYGEEIESGLITYKSYDTRDPATSPLMEEFNASKFAFFITTIKDGESTTWQVGKIWLYTDTTGTNQELKNKFIGELKKNIDKALSGES